MGNGITLGRNVGTTKTTACQARSCPARWDGLIGEYGWDHDVLYILEKDGRLHALIEWFFDYPLKEEWSRPVSVPGLTGSMLARR